MPGRVVLRALLACLLLSTVAAARPVALDIGAGLFDEGADPRGTDEFAHSTDGDLPVASAPGRTRWLHLRAELPEQAPAGGWVLRFQRAPIERAELWAADGALPLAHDSFYSPAAERLDPGQFTFALPPATGRSVDLYLALKARTHAVVAPRLLPAAEAGRAAVARAGWLGACVAALLLLACGHGALFAALHQRFLAAFAALAATALAWLLVRSGLLYGWPGGGLLAWLGAGGWLAMSPLLGAAALSFDRAYAPPTDPRPLHFGAIALLLVALLLATGLLPASVAELLALAATAACWFGLLFHAARGRRDGAPGATARLLLWLGTGLALAWPATVAWGLVPPAEAGLPVAPLLLTLSCTAFALVMTGRVAALRLEHEETRRRHQKVDADLQIEQTRRQFTAALQEAMRNASAPGDLEWRAFKQLAQTVAGLLPQRAVTVTATGYRGFDFLLTEPIGAKARYCNLLAARGATLKGICRSRNPVQLKLELEPAADGRPAEHALFAIVPMQIARPGWGAVLIERGEDDEFEPRELSLAAELVALTLETAEEGALRAELVRTAEVDPLTGVLNRRIGDERLEQLLRRATAERQPLSLLSLDIDHFKQINARHGHAAGDECLRALAAALRSQLGEGELMIRYGGEEFVLALPRRGLDEAREFAERLRTQAAALRVELDDTLIKLTISIGIAARLPTDERPQQLVERADRALYSAKRNGRNQVQVASAYAGEGEAKGLPPVL